MKRVNWASDDKFCQVKMFASEDCPSQIGKKTKDRLQNTTASYSNEMRSRGSSRSKEHSSTSKQVRIPVITWKCPPKFTLESEWQVAAGEESEERTTQNYRETRVQEALYPRVSAIPSSPRVSPEAKVCDYDDTQTPIIPLTPIEDEAATPIESMPRSEYIECDTPTQSKALLANDKLHATAAGSDADVVAAVTVAITALLKANEKGSMVDTDLLIKILNDPKMVEALLTESTTKMAFPVDPKHETCAELTSAMDNLFDPQIIQANSEIFGSNLNLQISDIKSSRPSSFVSSTRPEDQSLTLKTQMCLGSLPSHTFVSAQTSKPVDSVPNLSGNVVPASTRPEDQSLTQETQMFLGSLPAHSFVSTPVIKPLDNILGQSYSPKINPQMFDLVSFQPPSLVSSTRAEEPSSLTSHLSVDTRAVKDANYYKNLVRLHGRGRNEIQEQQTTQFQVSAPEAKVRKPCKFFNSSKGCRNGPTCPFEHVSLPNLQAEKFLNTTNSSKRLKISHAITG